jgi:hypothetical protein
MHVLRLLSRSVRAASVRTWGSQTLARTGWLLKRIGVLWTARGRIAALGGCSRVLLFLDPFLLGLALFLFLLAFDFAVVRALRATILVSYVLGSSIKDFLTSSSVYGLTSEPLL